MTPYFLAIRKPYSWVPFPDEVLQSNPGWVVVRAAYNGHPGQMLLDGFSAAVCGQLTNRGNIVRTDHLFLSVFPATWMRGRSTCADVDRAAHGFSARSPRWPSARESGALRLLQPDSLVPGRALSHLVYLGQSHLLIDKGKMPAQDKEMGGSWKRRITDAEVARIVADINRHGYGTLSNYVQEEELEPVRAIAHAAVRVSGGEYVCFTGPDALAGTVLGQLPQSAAFKDLCRRLYELGANETAPEVDFYQIFRCLQGTTGQSHSYRFHYDSYVLTALLPVEIPEKGLRGDLLVIPSTRRIRRRYLSNVLDKLIVDNKMNSNLPPDCYSSKESEYCRDPDAAWEHVLFLGLSLYPHQRAV